MFDFSCWTPVLKSNPLRVSIHVSPIIDIQLPAQHILHQGLAIQILPFGANCGSGKATLVFASGLEAGEGWLPANHLVH